MTDNNFQEGVGQKIVEALKQQDGISVVEPNGGNAQPTFESEQTANTGFQPASSFNIESNETFVPAFDTPQINAFKGESESFDTTYQQNYTDNNSYNTQNQNVSSSSTLQMPANVAVLRRLIAQLPNGVTKQTGAQIIRQTMEALGISMNNVLHEAQQMQDGLNDSAKTCMYSIQEYKNNIKQLEKQALDYQKQISYLNDLISLFVMTDKTRNI